MLREELHARTLAQDDQELLRRSEAREDLPTTQERENEILHPQNAGDALLTT